MPFETGDRSGAIFVATKAAFWHLDIVLDELLLRSALAGLRDVNLDVQISWQVQYFVDLKM